MSTREELVELTTKNMVDDHNKLVTQYKELIRKYDILLMKCVDKGVK